MNNIPTEEEFQVWPTAKVAATVRSRGPKVCVFPINGTRRWFTLEHPEKDLSLYMATIWRRQIEIYELIFTHGVDTLLTPIFGPDLLERGEEYRSMVVPGMLWLSRHEELRDFYAACNVRARVYGDLHRYLSPLTYQEVFAAFRDLAEMTEQHDGPRLFFGVCANDATETVAEIALLYYHTYGRPPNRREIVETYYGEYLSAVDFFIGFDRPAAFDMPLIATGHEDLYFTVSPSLYMDQHTLRAILYDHLYARHVDDANYRDLDPDDWERLKGFYSSNRHSVLGLGRRTSNGKIWYPLPQVELSRME